MAIERSEHKEKAPGSADNELLGIVQKLQQELNELKKKGLPQAAAASQVNETTSVIRELVSEMRKKTDKEKYDTGTGYVEEADIEPDDYIENGVTFFHYGVGYVIVDDVRKNHRISTPYRDIVFFMYQATIKTGDGKYVEVSNYSSYTSHSKKTIQWLREHSKHGIVFFEKVSDTLNVDAFKAHKLAKYMGSLNNMNLQQIIAKCKEKKIAMTDEVDVMKAKLANIYAEEETDNERNAHTARLMDSRADAAMLQK